jgi:hypothetical protein
MQPTVSGVTVAARGLASLAAPTAPPFTRGWYAGVRRAPYSVSVRVFREEKPLAEEAGKLGDRTRGLYPLAVVNVIIWAIAIIGLVFVIQRAPSAKGLFVILAGGVAVSVVLLSALGKAR